MPRPAVCAVLIFAFAGPSTAAEDGPETARRARGILSNRCFACHGPDEATVESGLRLDRRDSAISQADSGAVAILPGDADASELMRRITADDDERMPPPDHGSPLDEDEIETLGQWIAAGAPYVGHWAFEPINARPPVRPVDQADELHRRAENPIDDFLLTAMAARGLRPKWTAPHYERSSAGSRFSRATPAASAEAAHVADPPADRPALLRRVTLDLTGLPPTLEEQDAFLNDPHPAAYERRVDALLASPAFGEHWARKWLDLARYADSAGYADDPPRVIWAYRDWVIRSINSGMPFDQFTIEQLAGDLLENPSEDQLIATAFNRNTMTNSEGGTNDEEFRNVAVVDRVNTTMAVWTGLTMACAQCHSHKYDPFSHEEYFRLFAVFNQSEDSDKKDERPVLELFSEAQREARSRLSGEIEAVRQELQTLATAGGERLNELAACEEASADGADEATAKLQKRLEQLEKQRDQVKPLTTVPIMRDLPAESRRTTHIHLRGIYKEHGDRVEPGFPAALHAPADSSPPDRLALAKWLMQSDNPLTPRVIANRYWQHIFGNGIVPTVEDFGIQGAPPTHPELLDWLASELVRSGWDTKTFLRLLVTSAAYRQSASAPAEEYASDPDNIYLARGPRFRLTAEQIRDQALAAGGLLSARMYGPPVQPPQPDSGLRAAFGSSVDWKTSSGADRYRRGLYTTWRRSNPYPSMATFDAPNREVCVLRRDRTNTPLQALVTLNDPVFVEAAQGLARRIVFDETSGADFEARFAAAFRRVVSRPPSPSETDAGRKLYLDAADRLNCMYDEAEKLASDPIGPLPDRETAVELAAWTAVANVLLNLDETLMKR